jgi:hypothetical protein
VLCIVSLDTTRRRSHVADLRHVKDPFKWRETGHFKPIVPPFPARGLSRRRRRVDAWRYKWELPKPGSYNQSTWLQYFQGHQPPGTNGRKE